jgi:hypothetical protein
MTHNPDIEAMLDTDGIVLAGTIFGAVFEGIGLGGRTASSKVRKQLRARFGTPRWSDPNGHVYDAVAEQTILLWERATVASRITAGELMLLPRGSQLQSAPDPVGALRELLRA